MSDEEQFRKKNLEWFEKKGIETYPYSFKVSNKNKEIIDNFSKFKDKKVGVAGRIMNIRSYGKLKFLDLHDITGKIQLMVTLDNLGKEKFEIVEHLDKGDIIGAKGTVTKTKTSEITVVIKDVQLLSKCLMPIPDASSCIF